MNEKWSSYRHDSQHTGCYGDSCKEFEFICGDIDASGSVDIDDGVYLIKFVFNSGPHPMCYPHISCSDVDQSGVVDVDDIIYLIAYIFEGGPEPCSPPDGYTGSRDDWSREKVEAYLEEIQSATAPSRLS